MKSLKILALSAVLASAAACASNQGAVQVAQERRACAELGIDPGSQDFSSCVGNLDATMFEQTKSGIVH